MREMPMPRPLMTMVVITDTITVDSLGVTEWRAELPHVGILMGLRIECRGARKVVKRVRLPINFTSYVFDLPWLGGKRRPMYIQCGEASAPDVVGLHLQATLHTQLEILFEPGTYQTDVRVIMEYVPVPMPDR